MGRAVAVAVRVCAALCVRYLGALDEEGIGRVGQQCFAVDAARLLGHVGVDGRGALRALNQRRTRGIRQVDRAHRTERRGLSTYTKQSTGDRGTEQNISTEREGEAG